MAFIAAGISGLRSRPPGRAGGISGSSLPTPHPEGRSDSRRPPAGKSGAAPPSTSLFAINVSPIAVNHAIRRDATNFWVKVLLAHLQQRAAPAGVVKGEQKGESA